MGGNSIDHREICELEGAAALPPLPRHVAPGALVAARGARWRVDACIDRLDCRELHLRAAAASERRTLLWPFDRPGAVATAPGLRVLPLARWTKRAAAALGRVTDPLVPRGTFKGRILSYQLAPAVAIAAGISRVLLADEVGLGKTIQAGWILADLLTREPDARALIAVPAGLRDQWASELNVFFSLTPARVDAAWLRAATADRPADVSPWAAPGAYLASIDFLKRPDVTQSLAGEVWDLLIADEAHAAVAPTERHAMLSAVGRRARRVVLVTATPYSGDAAAFASLTSIGASQDDPPPLMFRRSREDVGDARVRRHRFATIRIGRAESRLQRLIERYSRDVWREASADNDAARLAMTILRKRALSSPAAVLRSLERRRELLRRLTPPPRQLSLFDEEPESDEALPDAALAAPGLADAGREEWWLTTLIDAAGRSAAGDSKQRALLRLVSRLNGEAVIVFTEYRDTLRQLDAALPGALHLHGGLTQAERADVQRRFNERGGILLATDAAADGLNLQQRCRVIVNYELPWNPARLEQRIGRVDRIGQRRRVHAITLVARDTAEDLVVATLARRLARVAATLGDRDRLASFLTDARTARAVIVGRLPAIDDAEPVATPPVRARAADFPVERVAALRRQAVGDRPLRPGIAIAGLHASGVLGPGWVAIVRIAAVTDRGVVAERPFILQLRAADVPRPTTNREARALARGPIAIAEGSADADPAVREWWAAAQAVQDESVRRRMAREQALLGERRRIAVVQPGLFDSRALDMASRRSDVENRRRDEHEAYARALEHERALRLECSLEALLIVWR